MRRENVGPPSPSPSSRPSAPPGPQFCRTHTPSPSHPDPAPNMRRKTGMSTCMQPWESHPCEICILRLRLLFSRTTHTIHISLLFLVVRYGDGAYLALSMYIALRTTLPRVAPMETVGVWCGVVWCGVEMGQDGVCLCSLRIPNVVSVLDEPMPRRWGLDLACSTGCPWMKSRAGADTGGWRFGWFPRLFNISSSSQSSHYKLLLTV